MLPDLLLNFGCADLCVEHLDKLTELGILAGIYLPLPSEKNIRKNREFS